MKSFRQVNGPVRSAFILLLLLVSYLAPAQTLTQTIRGQVVDADTQFPLPGVNIVLLTQADDDFRGSATDDNGQFRLEGVPLGRQALRASYTGYQESQLNNLIVTSGKEVVLLIELKETAQQLEDVVVQATRSGQVSNEMAVVSARQFSVDETDRYPGSRGDPSRMASNFAGVQGADDSRNDIVIRGNSPSGVLWQVEGVPIPNPNHFNIPGTAGGPVNILNNKVLANSDFYTGAFPAEFGNAIAGVFDISLRPGNNQATEFTGQLGLLGVELSAEGPLNAQRGSSFLAAYRYSTLSIFQAFGINIGVDAVPNYQDLNFTLRFPRKKGGYWSLWGLGGSSRIDIVLSDQIGGENIYGDANRDQYFGSNMGVLGATLTNPITKNTLFKATLALSREQVNSKNDLILTRDSLINNQIVSVLDRVPPILDYTFTTWKVSAHPRVYRKLSSRHTLTYGLQAEMYYFDLLDSAVDLTQPIDFTTWHTYWQAQQASLLVQPYIQGSYRLNDQLELTAGLHVQYFSLSKSVSLVEPRVGLRYQVSPKTTLSLGAGVHSQIQSPYLYFYSDSLDANGQQILYNQDMDFTKSSHVVASYERYLASTTRIKVEGYYQRLWNIPVDQHQASSFSLINQGSGFNRFHPDELINQGTGVNYGIEGTLERFFSKRFFFLLTGAFFEARYRGSDGILRDTDFNGNFSLNALGAYELKLTGTSSLTMGFKVTWVGGRRTGPVDGEASARTGELVYVDDLRNSEQFADYFRPDLRFAYQINRRKITHELALDFTNFIGRENVLAKTFVSTGPDFYRLDYQLGFFPVFYYKINF